jgi:hypothetical protein
MSSTTSRAYTTSGNYTFDSDEVEVTGGVAQLVDQFDKYQTDDATYTCAGNYTTSIDLIDGDGTLTGTGTGSPAVSGGKLDLDGPGVKYVDYDADLNADSQQVGCIRLKITPNYTGNPAAIVQFFVISKASGDPDNIIDVRHNTNGTINVIMRDSVSGIIQSGTLAVWSPTAATEYEFEFNWDVTAGATRFFIDGTQLGSTLTGTGTRDANIALLRIGSDITGTAQSDFKVDDLLVFSTVQHTANYTPAPAFPADKYVKTNPTIKFNNTISMSELLTATETTVTPGSDAVQHALEVSAQDKYWNGSAVVNSDGTYAQSNPLATINTNASSFVTAREAVRFLSFLHSDDGTTTPQLDLLTFTYDASLPDPTVPTLIDLNGFAYNQSGVAFSSQKVRVRPYLNGYQNGDIFVAYKWVTIATTDSDGFFSGNVVYPGSDTQQVEVRIGLQSYIVTFTDVAAQDWEDLTKTPIIEG